MSDELREACRVVERVFTDWNKQDSLHDMLEDICASILAIRASVTAEENGSLSPRDAPSDERHKAILALAITARCTELREIAVECRAQGTSAGNHVADVLDKQANCLGSEINALVRCYSAAIVKTTGESHVKI